MLFHIAALTLEFRQAARFLVNAIDVRYQRVVSITLACNLSKLMVKIYSCSFTLGDCVG